MKNKVLKTIGYIVGFMWVFSACCLDNPGYFWYYINIACGAYLALFSYANNWWNDYDEENEHGKRSSKCKRTKPLADSRTSTPGDKREYRGTERRDVSTTSTLRKLG